MNRSILCAIFALSFCGSDCAWSDEPASIPAASVDLAGKPINPFQVSHGHVMALLFIRSDCPIANSYAPELRRIEEVYAKRGVAFWLVYVDPDDTPELIRRHLRDYQLPGMAIRDGRLTLVKRAQARVTPECAVFSGAGDLLYHGRIDDRWIDLGVNRPEATRHDLALTLDAALAGQKPHPATTPAVGCFISNAP